MFFDAFGTDTFLLLTALLLFSGVLVAKFSSRWGIPSLILFILVGMLFGSDGLGIIYFDDASTAQIIGVFALVIILFEGGLHTKWTTVRSVAFPSLSLATLGVLLTSFIIGFSAYLIFNLTILEGMLLGAIVGSTDAAAVFAALKERNIKAKMGATLEAESGTNDPMAVFLTLSLIELLTAQDQSIWMMVPMFFVQMGMGLLFGIVLGKLASFSINRIKLDSSALYPIFSVAFALVTYSVTAFLGGSGFLAVYVAALVVGNSELTYRYSIFQFNEGFAWMAQILMFIILGLLVFPGQVFTSAIMVNGLLLSAILILVARPVAVFLSLIKMGYSVKEKLFISWAGLRGAVPIVLATFPIVNGIENSQVMFNIVFFIVLTSALVQGSTISYMAKKLHLVGPKKDVPHHSIELISMGKASAEMIQYQVSPESAVVGQKLRDVEFPNRANISAIIRNNQVITPYGETEIKAGDFLYILVEAKYKDQLKKVLEQRVERSASE
ncbi:K(+)/H(+) antiporter NhaP2 [Thalassobacillus devorans]|uniref:K(+)/H(+) antiporter NhaP2 n=1 Tax=Thalassobacillus devorans TaxID=279813 RepID=A0ABQ1NJU7_9BACI|nr:potassium/proton antiporter [Thalassobacillus devorans]NIK27596.1 cell volume regulation protein A [Thalassobacillus devorans]GGC78978.1 K(+)/H(+) antiporter NhaP2 [Thalassobacillus devorans]